MRSFDSLIFRLKREPIAAAAEIVPVVFGVEPHRDIGDLLRDLLVMAALQAPLARVLVLGEVALAIGGDIPA
jgi:hypothetical protein